MPSIGPAIWRGYRHTTVGHSGCTCCRPHACQFGRARNSTRGYARGPVSIASLQDDVLVPASSKHPSGPRCGQCVGGGVLAVHVPCPTLSTIARALSPNASFGSRSTPFNCRVASFARAPRTTYHTMYHTTPRTTPHHTTPHRITPQMARGGM